jgi:maleate isomerase
MTPSADAVVLEGTGMSVQAKMSVQAEAQPARGTFVVNKTGLAHTVDAGLGVRLRIGLIELATDQTSEHEFRRLLRLPGVDFYISRIWNDATITPDTLAAMERDIAACARMILPDLRLDVMGFTCTSGAMVIGEDKVFSLMRTARPGLPCTSPITAAMAAMGALKLKRIALLTPYVQSINDMMRSYIEARGVAVPVMGSFNNSNDDAVARISLESTRAAAIDLGKSEHVDGIFVSCTSLRTIDIICEVEGAIGKPMLASNPAQAWHLLRLGNLKDKLPQWGRLFAI